MLLQLITDAIGLAAIAAEPRAVAFLTVPWSGPERVARAAFLAAIDSSNHHDGEPDDQQKSSCPCPGIGERQLDHGHG